MKLAAAEWTPEAADEAAREMNQAFEAPDLETRCTAIEETIDTAAATFDKRGIAPYPYIEAARMHLAAARDFGLHFTRRPRNATWVPVAGSNRGGYLDTHGDDYEYIATPTAMFREHQKIATHRYGRVLRPDGMVEARPVAMGGYTEPESPDGRRTGGPVPKYWNQYIPLHVEDEPLEDSIVRLKLESQVEAGRAAEREARERLRRRKALRVRAERRRAYEETILALAIGMQPAAMSKRQRGTATEILGGIEHVQALAEQAMDKGLDTVRAEVARHRPDPEASPTVLPRMKKGKKDKMAKRQRSLRPKASRDRGGKQDGSGSSALADALRAALKTDTADNRVADETARRVPLPSQRASDIEERQSEARLAHSKEK